MISGHVFIASSLDGFIARQDDSLDWLDKQPIAGEDHGYDAFFASIDGLVMGRGSFQKVLSFGEWPYTKPVVVMSRSLGSNDVPPALRDKVELTDLDPVSLMETLEARGWRRVYVDGGRVIQSFLREDLIADLTLTRIPILLGDGISLFGPVDHDIDLEHLSTQTFPSGLVSSRYRVKANR